MRSEEELQAAVALRYEVFCVEQGVPVREELDGRDHQGLHLVAVRGEEVLATCRIVMVGSTAQFSRLAVRKSARRHGIATAMLEVADAETRAAGGRRIVLHAQTYARALYEQRRLPAPRPGLLGGRHRAHRDGEARVSARRRVAEVRVDPLTGLRSIIADAEDGLAVPVPLPAPPLPSCGPACSTAASPEPAAEANRDLFWAGPGARSP